MNTLFEAGYNPKQPRDKFGRWVKLADIEAAIHDVGKMRELEQRVTNPVDQYKLYLGLKKDPQATAKLAVLETLQKSQISSSVLPSPPKATRPSLVGNKYNIGDIVYKNNKRIGVISDLQSFSGVYNGNDFENVSVTVDLDRARTLSKREVSDNYYDSGKTNKYTKQEIFSISHTNGIRDKIQPINITTLSPNNENKTTIKENPTINAPPSLMKRTEIVAKVAYNLSTKTKATEKQVGYAMYLLGKTKYGNRNMHSSFKDLGASMRERTGSVKQWLQNLSMADISKLIDQVK